MVCRRTFSIRQRLAVPSLLSLARESIGRALGTAKLPAAFNHVLIQKTVFRGAYRPIV